MKRGEIIFFFNFKILFTFSIVEFLPRAAQCVDARLQIGRRLFASSKILDDTAPQALENAYLIARIPPLSASSLFLFCPFRPLLNTQSLVKYAFKKTEYKIKIVSK